MPAETSRAGRGLAHGELGDGTDRDLTLDARQLGADQASMHWTLFHLIGGCRGWGVVKAGEQGVDVGGGAGRCCRRWRDDLGQCGVLVQLWGQTGPLGRSVGCLQQRRGRRFLPAWRHLGVLVRVLGVTRRATGLLHVVADDGDHDVVREAALARTVVVDVVTEPRPA
jgi:hypothetical protein